MITRSNSQKRLPVINNSPAGRGRGKIPVGYTSSDSTESCLIASRRVVHSPPPLGASNSRTVVHSPQAFGFSNTKRVVHSPPNVAHTIHTNFSDNTNLIQNITNSPNHSLLITDSCQNQISTDSVLVNENNQNLGSSILITSGPALSSEETLNQSRDQNQRDPILRDLLESSISGLSRNSLEDILQPTGFIEKHNRIQARLTMASNEANNGAPNVDPCPTQNVIAIDSLLESLQQTIQASQVEFRAEINALKETISSLSSSRSHNVSSTISGNSHVNPTNTANHVNNNGVKIKDWKLSYDGTTSVSDFLFKVDTLCERNQCTDDFILSNFPMFLSGKADTWYWQFIKQNPNYNYTFLRYALTKEFGQLESDHEIMMRISLRKQHAKETYDEFHSSLVSMNLRMRDPISERSLIDIIKRNVNPNLKMLLFNSPARNLEDLRDQARKAERVLLENKNQFVTIGSSKHINEIEVDCDNFNTTDNYIDPQVDAISLSRLSQKPDYSKIKCWNCLNNGHSYIYCPEEKRNIFCYKCGQQGVVTTKCTNSHMGNSKRNEMNTGDSRYPK